MSTIRELEINVQDFNPSRRNKLIEELELRSSEYFDICWEGETDGCLSATGYGEMPADGAHLFADALVKAASDVNEGPCSVELAFGVFTGPVWMHFKSK